MKDFIHSIQDSQLDNLANQKDEDIQNITPIGQLIKLNSVLVHVCKQILA